MKAKRPSYLRPVSARDAAPVPPADAPSEADARVAERIGAQVDARIDRLERSVGDSLGSLEERLQRAIGQARADAAQGPLSLEVQRALQGLEQRIRGELATLRSNGDMADDLNRVLFALERQLGVTSRDASPGLGAPVDAYGRDERFVARLRPLMSALFSRYFRTSVSGMHNVPRAGRVLLVANHAGVMPWDGLMLAHAVKTLHPQQREVRTLTEDLFFQLPFIGLWLNRLGHVRASQDNAERMLTEEKVVAVFPEGEKGSGKLFRDRYRLQRFARGGFVKLAIRTKTPIIPVAIIGAEEVSPLLAKLTWVVKDLGIPFVPVTPTFPLFGLAGLLPLPARWSIVFGEAIDFSSVSEAALDDRLLLNKLTEQVRGRIQALVDRGVAARRSVYI